MASAKPSIPVGGEPITVSSSGALTVPDRPIIPFIEGDGTGPDIWRASVRVFDAAVKKVYGGKRQIAWMEKQGKLKKVEEETVQTEICAAWRSKRGITVSPANSPSGTKMGSKPNPALPLSW